jgi:Protein of unknown function (DUF2877)
MAVLPAHLVATPVLERLGGEAHGVVLGVGTTAAWVDLDGFVVAITTREVPLLPNAVALAAGSGTLERSGLATGTPARVAPGRIDLGPLRITWSPADPPAWDPTVPVPWHAAPKAVAERGAALRSALGAVDGGPHFPSASATLPLRGPRQPGAGYSDALDREAHEPGAGNGDPLDRGGQQPGAGDVDDHSREAQQPRAGNGDPLDPTARHPRTGNVDAGLPDPGLLDPDPADLVSELAGVGLATAIDPEGAAGLTLLFRAVRERDPVPARAAARALLGRGPGLTPEGDDLVAAVAGTLAVVGPVTGVDGTVRDALLGALVPGPGRTTALSATLLALASERRLAEPAGRLLDLGPGGVEAWPGALSRLGRLGHGSGRAYAAGIAATASLLAAGAPVR